jgi:hypothetical protein
LDGVIDYLPQPDEINNVALLTDEDEKPFDLDVSLVQPPLVSSMLPLISHTP